MIEARRYNDLDREQWNRFNRDSKNGLFMFDRNYMEYHSDRFIDHSIIFFDDDDLIALFPANESDGILMSHGGLTYGGLVIGNAAKQHTVIDCLESLKQYSRENRFTDILYKAVPHIYHIQPAEEDIYALYQQGASIESITASTVINLNNPIKMPKGRKAQISRAKREGVIITELKDKNGYSEFMELENTVLKTRHGISAAHTSEEMYLLHTRFPDNIRLYGAIFDNKVIAGAIVYIYRTVIHMQYMAADDKARQIGALDLTISNIMGRYSGSKEWLDFGISTDHEGKELNYGLVSQKEGFGGRTNIYMNWNIHL